MCECFELTQLKYTTMLNFSPCTHSSAFHQAFFVLKKHLPLFQILTEAAFQLTAEYASYSHTIPHTILIKHHLHTQQELAKPHWYSAVFDTHACQSFCKLI